MLCFVVGRGPIRRKTLEESLRISHRHPETRIILVIEESDNNESAISLRSSVEREMDIDSTKCDQEATFAELHLSTDGKLDMHVLSARRSERLLCIHSRGIYRSDRSAAHPIQAVEYSSLEAQIRAEFNTNTLELAWDEFISRAEMESVRLSTQTMLEIARIDPETNDAIRYGFDPESDQSDGPSFEVKSSTLSFINETLRKREELQWLQVHLSSIGLTESKTNSLVTSTLGTLDAQLTSISSAIQLMQYSAQIEHENRRQKIEASRLEGDRILAKLVGALVAPSIWFTFLSSRVLPENIFGHSIDNSLYTAISVAVGLLTGAASWATISAIANKKNPS